VECRGIPHLKSEMPRISCTRPGETSAGAAFCKESRMKFAEPIGPDRKSGDVGHPSICYAVKGGSTDPSGAKARRILNQLRPD
jgi:hypothetical protein